MTTKCAFKFSDLLHAHFVVILPILGIVVAHMKRQKSSNTG